MKTQYEKLSQNRTERGYRPPVVVPPYKKLKQLPLCMAQDSDSKSQIDIKNEPKSDQDIQHFLKSRPQIASLAKHNGKNVEPAKSEMPRTLDGKKADDLVNVDRFKDHPAAWQQSENIEDFFRRLPVEDSATAHVGPWLWVGSPTIPYAHSKRKKPEDLGSFVNGGAELLDSFDLQRGTIESQNPGKAPATITKKLIPHRDQLESDLLTLAVKMGTTSGKWMLFPDASDLARDWRVVATATADGNLGPVCKVGTHDPTNPSTLICIYTYDFSDLEDVRNVLNKIVDLGLCHADGKPLYYKCDAYTHLSISSGNSYKLRASLYSSKEILRNEVKALENGPVARMKKLNKSRTDFQRMFAGDDIS